MRRRTSRPRVRLNPQAAWEHLSLQAALGVTDFHELFILEPSRE